MTVQADFHLETLFTGGYAMLLVVIAGALEWMGWHSHRRSNKYQTGGFLFQKQTDHWVCPEGARLLRAEIDSELRVIRYRAPAHTCNRCPIKSRCTDSDLGREIEVSLDPWLESAIGRFHRGISLALLILAGLIVAIELVRHDHGIERWVLSSTVLMVSLLALHLGRALRGQSRS